MPLELVEFKRTLRTLVDSNELALPSNVNPTSFRNAAIVAYQDNPQIGKCTPDSIFKSVRKLAGMGLVPDGSEAALVPYRHRGQGGRETYVCQAIPMVAGLIKRARNSAEIRTLWAELVYEGEELTVWVEDGERKWDHRFDPLTRKGEIRGAYAVAKLADGTVDFEPMSVEEIEKIRAVSRAKDGPAWKQWYTEMAKKTVIRRLIKRLPVSTEDRRRIIESDSDTIGEIKDVTPKPTLQDRLDARTKETETPETPENVEDAETIPPDSSASETGEAPGVVPPDDDDEKGDGASPTYTPNPDNAFPMDDTFKEGWAAFEGNLRYDENPYVEKDEQSADNWAGGWVGAMKSHDAPPKKKEKA